MEDSKLKVTPKYKAGDIIKSCDIDHGCRYKIISVDSEVYIIKNLRDGAVPRKASVIHTDKAHYISLARDSKWTVKKIKERTDD